MMIAVQVASRGAAAMPAMWCTFSRGRNSRSPQVGGLGAIGIGGAGLLLQIDRPTLAQTAAPTTAQTIHVDAPPSTGAFKGTLKNGVWIELVGILPATVGPRRAAVRRSLPI